MKIKSILAVSTIIGLEGLLLQACGDGQPPAFTDRPRDSIFLTVDDDITGEGTTSADATADRDDLDSTTFDDMIDDIDPSNTDDTDDFDDNSFDDDTSNDSGNSTSDDDDTGSNSSDDDSSSDDNSGDDGYTPNESQVAMCAELQGVDKSMVKVNGNQNQVTITSNSVVAYKVNGNQSILDLIFNGSQGQSIGGICVFATGNQPSVNITANGLGISRLILVSTGNQATTSVTLSGGADIDEFAATLRGNQSSLNVVGYGAGCPSAYVSTKHNSSTFNCD